PSLYFWCFSVAAVSGSLVQRSLAGLHRGLGFAKQGASRPALVRSLSRPEDNAFRSAALDWAQPDLELHVRRLPFDQPAQELRPCQRQLRNQVVGDRRLLRVLP